MDGRLLNTRVLIVDDDRDTLEVMREFLRKVRSLPADQGGQTPAVAVSAHVE